MAKADCTPLAGLLTEIVRDLMADPSIKNLDDAVFEIQKTFPIVSRDEVVRSLNETRSTEKKKATEEQLKWRGVLNEAKKDPALKESSGVVSNYLEKGELPPEEAAREKYHSDTLEALKRTNEQLKKWLTTSDPAAKIKLQEKLDNVTDQVAQWNVDLDAKRVEKIHESLQAIQSEIDANKQRIVDAKTFNRLDKKLGELVQNVVHGTLPEKTARPVRGQGVLDGMRTIIDGLHKKISESEPAVREKLQGQIDALQETMRQIQAGTYEPPVKPEKTPLSEELQRKEYERDQLRREFRQAIENARPKSWWGKYNPFAFIHDLLTNGELSPVLRQGGVVMASRLGATIESVVTGEPSAAPLRQAGAEIQALFDALIHPDRRITIMAELMARDSTRRFIRSGGHISPLSGGTMAQREEFALSRLALKIPVMRDISQAGAVFLNLMRVNAFEAMSETLALNGSPTTAEMKILANMANQATGRGYEGGGPLGDGARVFFSLQYLTSRFNMLTFQPVRGNWDLTAKRARQVVAREYARMFLGLGAMYLLAYMAGAEIEKDRTSSDFLKWKFGRHRVDPLMGLQQWFVFGSRIQTGLRKSAMTGKITSIRGENLEYGQKTARGVIWDFLQSKSAPMPGFIMNVVSGQKMTGEPTNVVKELKGMMLPLTWVDIYHAMEEGNIPQDVAVSTLTFFGMGLQTFQPEEWPRKTKTRRRQ